MKKILFACAMVGAFLVIVYCLVQNTKPVYKKITIKAGEQVILAEVSDTNILRMTGLSGRKEFLLGSGMLFVFDKVGRYQFWMKDMNFPIDIVWIDALKQVVGVEENVSPESYPQTYLPEAPVLYVLELPALSYQKSPFTEISF